jgi:hypothetical protein
MDIKRVLITINAAICLFLLATGVYLVTNPFDTTDTNYYLLAIGVVASFFSLIGWSHLFSRNSLKAKKIRNMSSIIFIVAAVLSIAIAISVLQSLSNWG